MCLFRFVLFSICEEQKLISPLIEDLLWVTLGETLFIATKKTRQELTLIQFLRRTQRTTLMLNFYLISVYTK